MVKRDFRLNQRNKNCILLKLGFERFAMLFQGAFSLVAALESSDFIPGYMQSTILEFACFYIQTTLPHDSLLLLRQIRPCYQTGCRHGRSLIQDLFCKPGQRYLYTPSLVK
jgi:hypothetical protein